MDTIFLRSQIWQLSDSSTINSDRKLISFCVFSTMWSTPADKSVQNGQTYGMTSAISTAFPKPVDLQLTKEMEDVLTLFDVTETDEELNHRYLTVI